MAARAPLFDAVKVQYGLDMERLDNAEWRLMVVIADKQGSPDGVVFDSQASLAEAIGVGPRRVRTLLDSLERKIGLRRQRHYAKGRRSTDRISLDPRILEALRSQSERIRKAAKDSRPTGSL